MHLQLIFGFKVNLEKSPLKKLKLTHEIYIYSLARRKQMEIEDSYKILFMSVRHYHLPSKAVTGVPAADIDTIVFLCYFLIVALGDFLPHCTGWILTQLIFVNILVPDFDQKWFTIRKIALPQCCMCWKCKHTSLAQFFLCNTVDVDTNEPNTDCETDLNLVMKSWQNLLLTLAGLTQLTTLTALRPGASHRGPPLPPLPESLTTAIKF